MEIKDLTLDREGLIEAIACEDAAFDEQLRAQAYRTKIATVGEKVYLRGLIEISNICVKNCLYCGIRHDIPCQRYELTDEQVLSAAQTAARRHFGSVVIQGGERTDVAFIRNVTRLLKAIKAIDTGDDPPLGVTLSLGEQPREVYQEWFEAGAHRYLLRIESSNPDLYRRIHPDDALHSYERRMQALLDLKAIGYQAGTGAMIGVPFQTVEDLADDLLLYKKLDVPMVGMGPYNPHPDSPLTLSGAPCPTAERRFALGLKMIALLRLLMPDINIAAATSLEALSDNGRVKGILSGANVIMPNVTPEEQMIKYNLYDRKTLVRDGTLKVTLPDDIAVGYGAWGDSLHFKR